jgi:hypothetical protein
MKDDICYVPKYYAGKWYVHCTVTGWMGPPYDTQQDAANACREKNLPIKRGPETERHDVTRIYGY